MSGRRLVPPGETRTLSTDGREELGQFQDQTLVREGRLSLLSIDAVAHQLGELWSRRRPHVERYVERTLAEQLRDRGMFAQVSETDYLVCQPDLDEDSGHLACLRSLRKIMRHFLGASSRAPAGVLAVTAIDQRNIQVSTLSVEGLLASEARHDLAQLRAAELARARAPIVASNGRRVQVTCALQRVLELKRETTIGYRLAADVAFASTGARLTKAELQGLAGVDILKMDLSAATQGLSQTASRPGEAPLCLIVPVSYASLSSQRGRAEVVALMREAQAHVRQGVICEIYGVEVARSAVLEEAALLLRPFVLFLVGKLRSTSVADMRRLRAAGFRAVAVDCPRDRDDPEFIGWARATVKVAKEAAVALFVYGAPSARHAQYLSQAGATHVSLAEHA